MSCKCIWMAFFLVIYLMSVTASVAVFNPLRVIGHCPQLELVLEAVGRSSISRHSEFFLFVGFFVVVVDDDVFLLCFGV